ncbi:hypothetical protein EDD41_2714 [Luteococcus japonicus]|uniref:Uncharacterized protein n=1 Tax=Luteococcus japonicus TaxID=33984 RepID=A0A3N1ZX66_9ACTN|nr:hypothetical protein EDD41_2714 [Luteococcus japonicus]
MERRLGLSQKVWMVANKLGGYHPRFSLERLGDWERQRFLITPFQFRP